MKANLSKVYWPTDWKLYASMKRANQRAIEKFKNHPYAVKKVVNDTVQDTTKAQADQSKAHARSVL